jgi:hypothetical protein
MSSAGSPFTAVWRFPIINNVMSAFAGATGGAGVTGGGAEAAGATASPPPPHATASTVLSINAVNTEVEDLIVRKCTAATHRLRGK